MKRAQYEEVKEKALALYEKAHIVLTQEEKDNLEVADLGLGDIYRTGIEIVVYVNTELCCGKEMALLPHQTCPEHTHAPIPEKGYIGKEALKRFLNHPKIRGLPIYLETPNELDGYAKEIAFLKHARQMEEATGSN